MRTRIIRARRDREGFRITQHVRAERFSGPVFFDGSTVPYSRAGVLSHLSQIISGLSESAVASTIEITFRERGKSPEPKP
jgi:hypothetical protein